MTSTQLSRQTILFLSVALLFCLCAGNVTSSKTQQGEIPSIPLRAQQRPPTSQQEAEARRLRAQGEQLIAQGKRDDGVLLLDRAFALSETALELDGPTTVTFLDSAGMVYQMRGNYVLAEQRYLRALKIQEQLLGPTHRDVAELLSRLGHLYAEQGDEVKAGPMFERLLGIQEREFGPNDVRVAATLNELGTVYFMRGDYPNAESRLERALKIKETVYGPNHPKVANSLHNLGAMYFSAGYFVKAEPPLKRALAILEKNFGIDSPESASPLNTLGALYQTEDQHDRAEPLLWRAIKAWGPDNPNIAQPLVSLAWIYKAKRDYTRARQMLEQARSLVEQTLGPDHPGMVEFHAPLADIYEAEGDISRAINAQIKAGELRERILVSMLTIGSEQQKSLYMATLLYGINAAISLHIRSAPSSPEATRLALTAVLRRKGRVLDAMSDQMRALRLRLNPEGRELLDKLLSVRAQLAALKREGEVPSDPKERPEWLSRLEAEAEHLEAQISARSLEFRIQSKPVTVEQVQEVIPQNAVLIEFIGYHPVDVKLGKQTGLLGPMRYAAYVLRRTGAPAFVELGEAKLIDGAAVRFRAALRNPRTSEIKQAGRDLDEIVMRPVRKFLGQEQFILLSPDGDLNLIPFAALIDEQGRYLTERYTIDYLWSGRDLLKLEVPGKSVGASVIFANPKFDLQAPRSSRAAQRGASDQRRSVDFAIGKYDELPATADEADEIKRLISTAQIFAGTRATEEELKRVSAPAILHIATHGFFLEDQPQPVDPRERRFGASQTLEPKRSAENPLLRSGLVLAGVKQFSSGAGEDGVLTALEAAGLDLWGTKLVVLSACETGLGDVKNGEGVYGLRRALVLAGSETQVMSLWKVDDSVTRDLMIEYYTRLQKGEGRAEALRQVQLEMLRSRNRHPYYWSSFIVSGNWRNLAGQER
jgi:CHAT domain-containing protein/Tfp pilus assembly protein PilF